MSNFSETLRFFNLPYPEIIVGRYPKIGDEDEGETKKFPIDPNKLFIQFLPEFRSSYEYGDLLKGFEEESEDEVAITDLSFGLSAELSRFIYPRLLRNLEDSQSEVDICKRFFLLMEKVFKHPDDLVNYACGLEVFNTFDDSSDKFWKYIKENLLPVSLNYFLAQEPMINEYNYFLKLKDIN